MNHFSPTTVRGIGLIEVLVAVSIFALVLVAVVNAFHLYTKAVRGNVARAEAFIFAEEGIEAARYLRDTSYSSTIASFTKGMPYQLVFTGNNWIATTTATTTESQFTRTVTFTEVYRDGTTADIVASSSPGAVLDPLTTHVAVAVMWGLSTIASTSIAYENGLTDADIPGSQFPNNNGWGDPAQSFTVAGEDVAIPSVSLLLKRVGNPSPVYLEVRDAPEGAVLAASNTVDPASISDTALEWTTFSFASSPTLTASTEYYLRLRSNPDSTVPFSGAQGALHWGYGFPGSYAGGAGYRFVGAGAEELTNYDFSFRIATAATSSAKSILLETYITDIFDN